MSWKEHHFWSLNPSSAFLLTVLHWASCLTCLWLLTLAENEKILVYQVVPFWVQVTKKPKTNKNKNPQTSPTNEGCILAHIWKSPEIYRLQARLDLEAQLHPQHSDSISGILSSIWLCSQARCSHTVADTHQYLQF